MKKEILNKIKKNKMLSEDELNYIIKQLSSNKKYGLVWEDHPEDVELELKDGVFKIEELKDKRIDVNPKGRENLLLEGDNLHSLMALKEAGVKVDVIYIDPPYNTLSEKGFRYNDKKIDSNDNYRHSKWLSFMHKRLELARDLLTDDGVIFVSIDDNEQANLKLLMDQVFGEGNFISSFQRKTKSISNNTKTGISIEHDYVLLYSKGVINYRLIGKPKDFSNYTNPDNDPLGSWVSSDPTVPNGKNKFPIVNKKTKAVSVPPVGRGWAFDEDRLREYIKSGKIIFRDSNKNNERCFIYKRYLNEINDFYMPVSSICLTSNKYLNQVGTKELNHIFNSNSFIFPKPSILIKKLISIYPNKDAIILDFFAGSGTTGHAVMELNKEDGGNRKFILCTNNENNICEEVTYERNRSVITGEYAKEKVEPLPNNLSYYKVDILNKDDINHKEKERLEVIKNKYLTEWKEDIKVIKESEEYALMENNNKKVLFIKAGTISENTKRNINLNDIDKIYMMKHLSRDKMFKGIDESKLELI